MLIVVAGATVVYCSYRMERIPDIGEPFDVRSFSSAVVNPDENAFTLYREANEQFVPGAAGLTPGQRAAFGENCDEVLDKGWSAANPSVRRWLDDNRDALALWRSGTERSDAAEVPPQEMTGHTLLPVMNSARNFARLALFEAARLSAENRPAESWAWYRAALRSSRHVGMHSEFVGRLTGAAIHAMTVDAILPWAAQPALTAVDLRKALADAASIDAITSPLSESFQAEYLVMRNGIDRVGTARRGGLATFILRLTGSHERFRRSMNLAYANWLRQVDRPRYARPPIRNPRLPFFELEPGAPPSLLSLDPKAIEATCGLNGKSTRAEASLLALMLPTIPTVIDAIDREQARRSALILGLSLQLYYREHSQFPLTLDDLVKAGYLNAAPADPFGKGGPLRYRREPDPQKGARLWSVWTDGADQQGNVEVDRGQATSPGDKVFRIAVPRKKTP